MMHFLDISSIAFTIMGYPISYVELIGTLFGFVSVYYATKADILTWPTGIVNEFFLFLLFYQVHLYADMSLQVYFFIITLYGWHKWKRYQTVQTVSRMSAKRRLLSFAILLLSVLVIGVFFSNIHIYLPHLFKVQASYPFVDTFVMVASIFATILLAQKKIETWYLWIAVDIISVVLYSLKEVYFLSLEYLVFLGLATKGLIDWNKQLNNG